MRMYNRAGVNPPICHKDINIDIATQPPIHLESALIMPLKVIVIGAGLGGLATTIALTRAGHDVEVRLRPWCAMLPRLTC